MVSWYVALSLLLEVGWGYLPKITVPIAEGSYEPLYGSAGEKVEVKPFRLEVYPVTNWEFKEFIRIFPRWRRSEVKPIFADGNYLRTWEGDESPGENSWSAPVTNVSWFAADAYCKAQGRRLPTTDEWEYVAMAGQQVRDARKNDEYNKYILSWYEKPKSSRNSVGKTRKNYWGAYDMHGLVWEWTYDFNSVIISGESRKDVDIDSNQFCGSASLGASDLMNYAAFMRYAFRGSLKARYAVQNLGFRCAE